MQPDFAPLFSFTPMLVFLAFAAALAVYLWCFLAGTKAFCARVHHWLGEPRADLVQAITNVRWPLAVSALIFMLFVWSAQTHEVLAKMAERLREEVAMGDFGDMIGAFLTGQNFLAFILLILLYITLFMNADWLLHVRDPEGRLGRYRPWLVRLTAILPLAGVLIGSIRAAYGDIGEGLLLPLIGLPGVMMVVAFIVLFFVFGRAPAWLITDDPALPAAAQRARGVLLALPMGGLALRLIAIPPLLESETHRGTFRTFAVLILLVVLCLLLSAPVAVPQLVGPAGVLFLSAIGLSSLLTLLTRAGDKLRLPLIGIVALMGVAFSALDWTDNHLVPQQPLAAAAMVSDPAVAFERWSAPLRGSDGRINGPVYVVAAQGGGLYAATHTALFLARMHDMSQGTKYQVPTSARIFAISGVSGGSVGAAVFEIVRSSGVCDPAQNPKAPKIDCHTVIVQEIMRHDFLSPLIGGLLFTDLAARLIPPMGPKFALPSRSEALQGAFEEAIYETLVNYGLTDDAARAAYGLPLAEARYKDDRINSALMLFNTTDVNTGERVVISRLRAIDLTEPNHLRAVRTYADVTRCPETAAECPAPTMLAAALISARFPFVTPAASVYTRNGVKLRLVDGGYYENSGTETLSDLIDALGRYRSEVRFELVALDFEPSADDEIIRAYWAGETLSPLRAMLATRQSRGELPKRRSENRHAENWRHSAVRLDRREDAFTLGWILSQRGLDEIACHVWDNRTCASLGIIRTATMDHNRCVMAQLSLQGATSNCN
ncbi:MAG: hypothetical protein WBN04_20625 [Paracoccaceae bacterium]